jgi:isoleucyl-tRNA synthetase
LTACIRCEQCGRDIERIPEVGDAWLDAGIVNFSTLGWHNPEWKEHGYATGASAALSGADLPDHAYWEEWFPSDWVSEMREQIRLWFYSQCFMAVTLEGRSPYKAVLTYEKVFDERGKPMHKSTGNSIELNDALERMGADVARWLYCAQPSNLPLRFGYGLADEVKRAAHLLELRLVLRHLCVDRGVRPGRTCRRARAARPLARIADGAACARRDCRVRALLDTRRRRRLRVLCGGPVELVHPPLPAALLG